MISVIDCNSAEEDVWGEPEVQADIMAAEFVHGKPYTCPVLTPSKGKEVAKPKKEAYLFDISKADQIFECLVKYKQIKLLEDHKIPLADKIKGKKYCKWCHSWTHITNNCIIFRNAIQKDLQEGRLKLVEKRNMTIDTNPFGLSINMVSIFIIIRSRRREKSLDGKKSSKRKRKQGFLGR